MEKLNLMMRKEDLNVIIHISNKNAKHTDRGGGSQKHVCILHNFYNVCLQLLFIYPARIQELLLELNFSVNIPNHVVYNE